jgi:pimeloyl-ACP methyl ester carboxylesterase
MTQRTTDAGGVSLCYETFGDADDPALLLVMGMGTQLISWEPEFCQAFADEGFFVIRYDHRDVGLSQSFEDGPPYTLSDLAADGMALLTALGVERAHVVGASMGGMIAQLMAIEHPDRVLSLCSIMSGTGAPGVNQATPEALAIIGAAPTLARPAAIQAAVDRARFLAGPTYPFDEGRIRRRAAAAFDRADRPDSRARQREATRHTADRTPGLAGLRIPVVVIHGDADPVMTIESGRATAAAVPGSRLVVIEGMGHEIPAAVEPLIVGEVAANARRTSA